MIKPDGSIVGGNPVTKVFDEARPERIPVYEQAQRSPYYVSEPYASRYVGWTVTIAKSIPWQGQPFVAAVDLNLGGLEDRLLKISRSDDYQLGIVTASGLKVARSPQSNAAFRETNYRLTVGDLTTKALTTPKDEVLTTRLDAGAPLTVVKRRLTRFDWTVFAVLDETHMQASLAKLQTYYAGLLAIGLLLSLVVSALVTRYIRLPVGYLTQKMRLVRSGNLDVRVANRRTDEFGELAASFDDMLQRIRELIAGLNASEQMKRKLEIQVLQAQINPHFLYNTLGAICNVVDLERYEEVDGIVAALIAILEYGVERSPSKVALQEELANVQNYMYIQNIRYERRFRLVVDIPDELLVRKVPRMILQPLVENSLFHGYCGGLVEGEIAIRARCGDASIEIDIVDSGVGMDEETASSVLERGRTEEETAGRQRIGLYNIHKRIQLDYGEPFGATIESRPGAGTTIRLRVPDETMRRGQSA
ncbi:MAG: sensor histidine kinase [Paenibacillaceae bacterium]|nr:sensor histidine kinase [Paenibacillaceae bacterium]